MAGALAGKTMFISGASRGIGLAIAKKVAADGANVALIAKTADPHPRLPGTVYTAAEEIEAAGGHALPIVGDIRGRGLFRGIELVADRNTKAPFDPGRKLHAAIKKAAMAEGLMCYPMGGTVDGEAGDHILLAPPYIIDDSHIDEIVDRLGRALDKALPHAAAAWEI